MDHEEAILRKYQLLAPELTERALRLFAAAEAKVLGRGGIAIVSRAIEISRDRISRGLRDLDSKEKLEPNRIRRKGGGRKKQVDLDPTLKRRSQAAYFTLHPRRSRDSFTLDMQKCSEIV